MISTLQDDPEEPHRLDWSRVQKVLLVRLRSIGDTVLMTPCLEAIKALRSDIRITVVSEPLSAPILEDHPLVDQLIVTSADFKARAKLIKTLRRSRFDVAFNLHGGTTATLITALSGAAQMVGFAGYRHSWLLNQRAPAPDRLLQRQTVHSVEQQLALLAWTGIPMSQARPRLSLQVSQAAKQAVCERLNLAANGEDEAPKRFAVIAPAAAFEAKRWPCEGFAEIVDHLSDRFQLPCVIIAGPEQQEIADNVASLAKAEPQVIGGLSLKELMALINLSSLFVGNDSGPMHIAAACKRPVVGIFGTSNPDVWHPWTEAPNRVVAPAGTKARVADRQAAVTLDTEAAIRSIPVAVVSAAVDEVLQAAAVAGFKALAS